MAENWVFSICSCKGEAFPAQKVWKQGVHRDGPFGTLATHVLSYCLRVLCPVLRERGRKWPSLLIKDKCLQGILTPASRRKVMLDRTWFPQEVWDIGRHPHCLGTPALSRTTARGNSNMGRYNFRATAIVDDSFYCESLWLPNSSFVIKVGTGEFFIIGISPTLWWPDTTPWALDDRMRKKNLSFQTSHPVEPASRHLLSSTLLLYVLSSPPPYFCSWYFFCVMNTSSLHFSSSKIQIKTNNTNSLL